MSKEREGLRKIKHPLKIMWLDGDTELDMHDAHGNYVYVEDLAKEHKALSEENERLRNGIKNAAALWFGGGEGGLPMSVPMTNGLFDGLEELIKIEEAAK